MFIDFLDKCEGIDIFSICDYLVILTAGEIIETLLIPNSRLEFEETTCTIIPEHILVFSTALHRIPPGGFPVIPTIKFTDGKLATANTCELVLHTPICHQEPSIFEEYIILSIKGCIGFDTV